MSAGVWLSAGRASVGERRPAVGLTGGAAALVFAVTRIPWDHAVHADVHPLALAALGAAFWAALRWGRTGSSRVLIGCAGAAALALAVHSGTILVVPGVVLAALTRR